MAKTDDRPLDVGLAALRGNDEASVIEWWKQRLALIAAIPVETARAGAMVPQIRELSRLPAAERRRLTKAQMQAFVQLPRDQQELILVARKTGRSIDPELLASDDAVLKALSGEVTGIDDLLLRTHG